MNAAFHNLTAAWSADELLADLTTARALRHIAGEQMSAAATTAIDGRPVIRLTAAFADVVSAHGYSCDTCGTIVDVPAEKIRQAADRILDNLDGRVRLLLCQRCSGWFDRFCLKEFGRSARASFNDELEQMMLAFIAAATRKIAKTVSAEGHQCAVA